MVRQQRCELHKQGSLGFRLTMPSASPSIPELSNAQEQLCNTLTAMTLESRSLLDLPAEVRLIVYKYLYAWPEHIKLRLLDTGHIQPVSEVKLNLSYASLLHVSVWPEVCLRHSPLPQF